MTPCSAVLASLARFVHGCNAGKLDMTPKNLLVGTSLDKSGERSTAVIHQIPSLPLINARMPHRNDFHGHQVRLHEAEV